MSRIFKASNFKKTFHYLKKNGIRQAYFAARERMQQEKAETYVFTPVSEEKLEEQRREGKRFSCRFSILVPAYETEEAYLRAMIDSVLAQSYGNFELILADASDRSEKVRQVTESYQDPRICYRKLQTNGGISANTNYALMYATGDYAGLLDHDDVLTPDALYEMAVRIEQAEQENRELQLLYSDEDKCSGDGSTFFDVNRKPDFNLDLLLSNNYICHFLVMKRQLMQELSFRSVCDGAQDYDLVLRCVSYLMGKDRRINYVRELPIAHVPAVLYHWRCHEASTAENPESKRYAYEAGKRAVEGFLRAREWKGRVSHLRHLGFYRVDYEPDLFANRPDTALIGGRLIGKNHKVAGGIYTREGTPLYLGLHKEFSGYLHRAVLQQEAQMIDIRCMKCSPEAELIMEELLGLPYLKNPVTGRFDWRDGLKRDADYLEISRRLCEKIREKQMRILWDPAMIEKLDD